MSRGVKLSISTRHLVLVSSTTLGPKSERTWKTFLVFDKLIIANDAGKRNTYTFDAEKDEIVLLYRNFDDSAESPTEEDNADSDNESLSEDAENSDE